jgi:hypothetical protein
MSAQRYVMVVTDAVQVRIYHRQRLRRFTCQTYRPDSSHGRHSPTKLHLPRTTARTTRSTVDNMLASRQISAELDGSSTSLSIPLARCTARGTHRSHGCRQHSQDASTKYWSVCHWYSCWSQSLLGGVCGCWVFESGIRPYAARFLRRTSTSAKNGACGDQWVGR